MDAVFGYKYFLNEIIWERYDSHNNPKRFGRVSDAIFFYSKTDRYIFNPVRVPYSEKHLKTRFRYKDPDGRRFWPNTCLAPGGKGPRYKWKGHIANWRFTKERMTELDAKGEIYYSKSGFPYRKNYLDLLPGQLAQNIWTDIKMTRSGSERLGYPTQKPEALLERIIKASSNEGDIVLDPFCGCGTTITVAERLKRKWIGIDVTHLAISLMRHRLKDTFGDKAKYKVVGEPVDLRGSEELAKQDRYQFQWWALGLVGARPAENEKKKGADKGIDGYIYFHDEPQKTKKIIIQVKSGHVNPGQIRDLRGTIERVQAQIGVFITLNEPTIGMRKEAVSAGYYRSPGWNKNYPKIQILTIKELLKGKGIDYPPKTSITFKKAKKAEVDEHVQLTIEEKI